MNCPLTSRQGQSELMMDKRRYPAVRIDRGKTHWSRKSSGCRVLESDAGEDLHVRERSISRSVRRLLAGTDSHLLEKSSRCWINHWEAHGELLVARYGDQGGSGTTDSPDF